MKFSAEQMPKVMVNGTPTPLPADPRLNVAEMWYRDNRMVGTNGDGTIYADARAQARRLRARKPGDRVAFFGHFGLHDLYTPGHKGFNSCTFNPRATILAGEIQIRPELLAYMDEYAAALRAEGFSETDKVDLGFMNDECCDLLMEFIKTAILNNDREITERLPETLQAIFAGSMIQGPNVGHLSEFVNASIEAAAIPYYVSFYRRATKAIQPLFKSIGNSWVGLSCGPRKRLGRDVNGAPAMSWGSILNLAGIPQCTHWCEGTANRLPEASDKSLLWRGNLLQIDAVSALCETGLPVAIYVTHWDNGIKPGRARWMDTMRHYRELSGNKAWVLLWNLADFQQVQDIIDAAAELARDKAPVGGWKIAQRARIQPPYDVIQCGNRTTTYQQFEAMPASQAA